jgi:DNA-directed RNA polymerase specialized sigma24 family protein
MEHLTERSRKPGDPAGHTTIDVADAIRGLSDGDMVRLGALARLWSRGLPGGFGWTDVLNEAIARVLDGSRPWPPGVPLLAFLSGVMRSICDDHWRRARRERELLVSRDALADRGESCDEAEQLPDPERTVAAAQALASIYRLFARDRCALKIIAGLADGLSASEICSLNDMSERDYDTARKRMRRALLRHRRIWGLP